jgi:hypothetical protein
MSGRVEAPQGQPSFQGSEIFFRLFLLFNQNSTSKRPTRCQKRPARRLARRQESKKNTCCCDALATSQPHRKKLIRMLES